MDPELLEILLAGNPMPPVDDYVPEPLPRFPERSGASTFGGRFLESFADRPTNFQGAQSPLMALLQSTANSASGTYAARQARLRARGQADAAAQVAQAREERAQRQKKRESDLAYMRELGKLRLAAQLKPAAEKKALGFDDQRPGESDADFIARQGKLATAKRAPETPKAPDPDKVAARNERRDYAINNANRTILAIDEILPKINAMTSGLVGQTASNVPGTDAYNVRGLLETIKGNISFQALQAMRQASPTGGALGPVSDMEINLLSAVEGSLRQGLSDNELRTQLLKVKSSMEKWKKVQEAYESGQAAQPASSVDPNKAKRIRAAMGGAR